jgi:hypothetical protein
MRDVRWPLPHPTIAIRTPSPVIETAKCNVDLLPFQWSSESYGVSKKALTNRPDISTRVREDVRSGYDHAKAPTTLTPNSLNIRSVQIGAADRSGRWGRRPREPKCPDAASTARSCSAAAGQFLASPRSKNGATGFFGSWCSRIPGVREPGPISHCQLFEGFPNEISA